MKRIREIAETRVRYGYRRIHVLRRREGWLVNSKRVFRVYREIGLQLRNKSPKRRAKAQLRSDRAALNQVWAMHFVHDQMFDGRKIRILTHYRPKRSGQAVLMPRLSMMTMSPTLNVGSSTCSVVPRLWTTARTVLKGWGKYGVGRRIVLGHETVARRRPPTR